MDRQTATKFIQECLSQPFDEGRFKRFTNELLNHMEARSDIFPAQYIKDAFKDHVRLYKRVGKYTDPDGFKIDVLIVYLRKTTSLDRARTKQRDFVVDYLKTRGEKDAGLVAYVSDDPADWRFSLVRVDYRTVETPTGRVKIKEELTPARRFSFLVGQNEPHHTAQQQLFPILADTAHDPTLTDLEIAFSIEPVTKEFFNQYKERYLDLKEELDRIAAKDSRVRAEFDRCGIDTAGFAKKLLGQIVFLYFLQKKGWLGVQPGQDWGTGSKNFLQELFQKKQYNNFFDEILEPLFYDALAVERPGSFYPRLNSRIPFLNGGLFEPFSGYDWRGTDLSIRNEVFESIFQTFNQYNFTVREDDPLEREVAVDPEMLGKVFENLLEVQDRKSKGAFYTPREIVHYMCQESLINYLDTTLNRKEHKLAPEDGLQGQLFGMHKPVQKAISIEQYTPVVPRADIETFIRKGEMAVAFDTAKEAGTTSYKWQMPESIRTHARDIDRALADIRICDPAIGSGAFPVGMMTEIVKARQVLNTYLPQDPQRTAYAFKRHTIEHSIYGVDIEASAVDIARLRLWLSLVVDEDDFRKIRPLPNLDYKIVCGNSLQSVKQGYLAGEIEAMKGKFQIMTDRDQKAQLKAEIDRTLGILTERGTKFDFKVYFSEVFRERGGFDVVIANPPYVRGEKITGLKESLKKQFTCYVGTADLYVYFYERGIEILRPNGTLTFISSNKYFRSGYGEKLRAFLAKHTIHQLIDFGDAPVFDAIAYPSIILLQKTAPQENRVRAMTWKPGPPIQQFAKIYWEKSFLLDQKELKADGWRLESPGVYILLNKLLNVGKPLGEFVNGKIYYGIKTGLNKAFIVDRTTRDRLIAEHPSSADLLRPILRGKDVKRWQISYADLYLIQIESSENKRHLWSGMDEKKAEQVFKRCYPAVYRHLMQYRDELIKRDDQGKYFWELRSCKYWDEFKKPKVIYPNICKRNEFAFDRMGYVTNQKAFIIPDASPELVGILNSNVIHWLFQKKLPKLQGDFFEPSLVFFQEFPIPPLTNALSVRQIVEQIESAITRKMDAKDLEQQLNQEVYKLYGLTKEEIALIEGETQTGRGN